MRTRFSSGSPLTTFQQLVLGVCSVGLLIGFGFALSLTPDSRGFGTHQQLGFPPCAFRLLFGIVCPSCGGTTCFAHFVRGQWWSAMRANPAIFVLALWCAALIPWSWISIVQKRAVGVDDPARMVAWSLILLSILAILQWSLRLMLTT